MPPPEVMAEFKKNLDEYAKRLLTALQEHAALLKKVYGSDSASKSKAKKLKGK